MKKLILLLSAMFLLVACGTTENGNAPANNGNAGGNETAAVEGGELDKEKTYIIGLDDTFAPMGFRDENGELVGFDVELAEDAAERMGIQIEFQPIDWSMKETELNAGNIDFIWNGYSITPEREEKVAFSTPYLENRQIIVTMADSEVNTKADLEGKVISIQAESSALDAVNKEPDFVNALGEAPVEYATNNEAFKDVEIGRADAIVVDEVLARYYMKQNGEEKYKVLEENFGDEEFGVGVRKDDTALLEALNDAFAAQKDDGKYDEIYSKWFADNE
ncbi:amino acid ABC transporter substrate-binding protein [Peptoniphilus sp. KCTC 25270]|uniref:amino acid ABC transporter substrate-binding protein n=1 Tax=Peptoniphilus sp. KCTC 25270 TaxID=2897414 RepID=UPI001E4B36B3|nr:amino acid ABC transporter substrate-binding protein [Peptoniphilus sp. KCTC 25270]MCD1147719.1 amino acid ABC transporter substrate-binding protein [Peptoniphilus sp. KCTC 25270]